MIKLKDLLNLKEAEEKAKPEYSEESVFKFFSKNKSKLKKFYDEDEWDEFYELAFDEFTEEDQDMVATAMNRAATMEGWFDNETEDYRQSEAELDMMANGTKKQQKGVDTAAYDKKAKAPKASPTDLFVPISESTKKETIEEAEYKGRKVKLGKPFYTPGGPRKRAVYVRNDKGNVVKVGFGEPGMKIKKDNPARRKSFRARHKCDTPGPRWKARYWSCKAW